MKAAVLHEVGGVPKFEDFPDPVPGDGDVLIEVAAVAVENVDRLITAGRHFTSDGYLAELPMIPGFDGVGALSDGTLVGFGGTRPPYGALAERTVVAAGSLAPIPEGLGAVDAVVLASAMPAMSLRTAAALVPGETVLIQGATGVAGRLAVKVARLLGAGRIVATGRDDEALREVAELGADVTINTAVSDEELAAAYTGGYDVVLDFLWGRPTEVLLRTLVPKNFGFPKPTRLIQMGASAGPAIALDADSVRTSGVEIYGGARGFDPAAIGAAYQQVVQWARDGELTLDIETVPLSRIEEAWTKGAPRGKRLVIVP